MNAAQVATRLLQHVTVGSDRRACWLWAGARNNKGYGQLRFEGRTCLAHRVVSLLVHGPLPPDTCVLHRCDTPGCCNPRHLFRGGLSDNARDMYTKRRGRPHGQPALSGNQIRWAREQRAAGRTQAEIGRELGVTQACISLLERRTRCSEAI